MNSTYIQLLFLTGMHTLVLVVLLWGLNQAIRRIRLYAALLGGLAVYQLLALPSLPHYVELYGVDVVFRGLLMALAGASLLVLFQQVFEKRLAIDDRHPRVDFVDRFYREPGKGMVIALAALAMILAITAARGGELLLADWETARSQLGFLDSVATLLQFLAFPLVWLTYRLGRPITAFVLGGLLLAVFVTYGSRAALLTLPAIAAIELYTRGRLAERRTALFAGLGVLAAVIVLHVGGRIVRGLGIGGAVQILQGDFSAIGWLFDGSTDIDWTGGESDIGTYYFFVISQESIPGVEPLASVIRWLTIYLPRWLAEDFKPVDPTYLLWTHAVNHGVFDAQDYITQIMNVLRQGEAGSVHPLYWGEAWINGGLPALATMSIMLAFLTVCIDWMFRAMPATVATLTAPALAVGYLMVARGNSVIGLGLAAYLIPPALFGYGVLTVAESFLSRRDTGPAGANPSSPQRDPDNA